MSRTRHPWAAVLLILGLLAAPGSGLALQESQQKEGEKPKAEQTDKKKKKKKAPAAEPGLSETSTREVLSRVLRSYKQGFESLSPSAVREAIDANRFYDFPRFEEGVTQFLRSAGELRMFTREVNVQVEGDRAVMIVDAEMVFAPRDAVGMPVTRTSQITFDFERTPRGWKITEINPRTFFLP